MPRPPADRELRRFITEIAEARDEDLAAILGHLDPESRDEARSLLASYGIRPDASPARTPPANPSIPAGVSAWLADRLTRGGNEAPGLERLGAALSLKLKLSVRMTPDAAKLLRSLAAAEVQNQGAVAVSSSRRAPSWLGGLGRDRPSQWGRA